MSTTIRVSKELKEMLDKLKIHPRETNEDVIRRLINVYMELKNAEVVEITAEDLEKYKQTHRQSEERRKSRKYFVKSFSSEDAAKKYCEEAEKRGAICNSFLDPQTGEYKAIVTTEEALNQLISWLNNMGITLDMLEHAQGEDADFAKLAHEAGLIIYQNGKWRIA